MVSASETEVELVAGHIDPPLSDKHRAELHASGITDERITAAGLYTASNGAIAKLLGWQPKQCDWGVGLVYPYSDGYSRVKLDFPRSYEGKAIKYESPKNAPNRAYFPPGSWELLPSADTIVVTEGEKKALAVAQLGIPCIGLVGVWGWQEKRQRLDTGKAYGKRRLIDDLKRIDWHDRNVVIAFDSDAVRNALVQLAEARLADMLTQKGAAVRVARIPATGDGKVGADDFIVAHGEAEFRKLLDTAEKAETPAKLGPLDWARMFVGEQHTNDKGVTLRWHRKEFYAWTGTHYRTVPDGDLEGVILQWLDEHGTEATPRLASDVLKCAASEVRVPFDVEPPAYIGEHGNVRHNWVAMRNGLLNLDDVLQGKPITLTTHTPRWFSPFALPYDYRPDAECPVWFKTLDEIFDGDEERVDLLGEWFGYCLTTDTTLEGILLFEGPTRSGKSTILRTLAATIGHDNCVSPSLPSLSDTFGLWPLYGKRLAYCPDAHLGRGDAALAVLERLKCISGQDPVDIHRKHIPTITNCRLRIKFALAVNELPKFGDNAGALGPRVHIMPCRNSFVGREDRQREAKLSQELPGIFNFGLEGLVRLRKQGEFTRPQISRAIEADFARLVSPLKAFVDDRCEVRPGLEVKRDELWGVWKQWCDDNGHLAGSRELLGSRLRAMIPNLDTSRPRVGGVRVWSYVGLGLREAVSV
jgi:putative DNA primase/helicase